ncbi:tandem-95 repeat protein, partial [Pseudahrensia aquimaris]
MLSTFGKIFRRKAQALETPDRQKPLMRALEPRMLLDAAAVESAEQAADKAVHSEMADLVNVIGDDTLAPEGVALDKADLSRDIVFIDGNVPDIGTILSELDPDVEVHILDLQSDGVGQMADIMDGRTEVAAIHIFSHGGEGFLSLGNGQLTTDTISGSHVESLMRIGASLSEGGDILIYGCNFGAGEQGQAAAERLSQVTGADIAASDDLTGAAEKGGDWDLEVVAGEIQAKSITVEAYGEVLDTFELGTVTAPSVDLQNTRVIATVTYGGIGSTALWANAGTVQTAGGPVAVDIVATVIAESSATDVGVNFGTRDDDEGNTNDPTLDDFRVQIRNGGAATGNTYATENGGTFTQVAENSATIRWEIFEAGTWSVADPAAGVKPAAATVNLTISDIDGGGGLPDSREEIAANLTGLSSYTVQEPTNMNVTNDGTNISVSGTQGQNNEEESWVQFSWGSVNQLDLTYTTHTVNAFYNHDGDGDLVFTNPNTAFATGIDLDSNDSSGATGSNYQTVFLHDGAGSGAPVSIADGDIMVDNDGDRGTSAVITLTNAFAGDDLILDTAVLASLGLTGTVDTSTAGVIQITINGEASTLDYQTAIQSITFQNLNVGFDQTTRQLDVQVFDGAFASGIANTAITFGTIINQPSAVRDIYVGDEDTLLTVPAITGLLANDSDPTNDPITVTGALDSAGNAITVNPVGAATPTVHTLPSGALLTLFADGSLTYDPPADYSGVEFFNYTVEDNTGLSAQSYASINIRGIADAPNVPATIESVVSDEDQNTNTVDLTSTQTDVDGSESLRYLISQIPTGFTLTDGALFFTSASATDIAFLDGWDLTNISLIRPTADNSDEDIVVQLTVESTEPNGSTASSTESVRFNVAAVADAPTLNLNTTAGGGVDVPTPLGPLISATLADADGSETIVSYTFSNFDTGFQLLQNGVPLTPAAGPHTVLAADLATLSLQTTPGFLGVTTVDVVATAEETNAEDDVSLLSANSALGTLSITIDNVDDPVTANPDTGATVSGGTTTITPLTNDVAPDGFDTITLIDGQVPTVGVELTLTSGNGFVTLNADGSVTFRASDTFTGDEVVTYTVADADGDADSSTLTITVNPSWRLTGSTSVAEGSNATYTIEMTGPLTPGQSASVDIALSDIETTNADYADLAAAITAAVATRDDLTFDGTTLTYTANYEGTYSATGGGFTDISGSGTATGLGDEANATAPIGFDFEFYGQNYSSLFINDNGFITFGGSATAWNNTALTSGTVLGGNPTIAVLWDDFNPAAVGEVYYETSGAVGSRTFTAQWDDVAIFGSAATDGGSFQIVLNEADGSINFFYNDVDFDGTNNDQGASATIGVQDGNGIFWQQSFNAANAVASGSSITVQSTAMTPLVIDLGTIEDPTLEADEDFNIALSNATNSGIIAAQDDVTTTITDTNDAPVLNAPVTTGTPVPVTTTLEDTPLVFSAANGNPISIDNPDGNDLSVLLSVSTGILNVTPGSGAIIGSDGTGVVAIQGTQAQVNAALAGLIFTPVADNNGTATLSLLIDDLQGEPNSVVIDTIDIGITAVADTVQDSVVVNATNTVTIPVLNNDTFENVPTNVIATNGANGTVVVNPDNTITYTWTSSATAGSDTFTYTVTSGGVTETETVFVLKYPPAEAEDDTQSTNEDAVINVPAGGVLDNDLTVSVAPTLGYDTIDIANNEWDDASNTFPFTLDPSVTENTSPTTAFTGITSSLVFDGTDGGTATSLNNFGASPGLSASDTTFELWFSYDPADYSGNGAILFETGGGGDGMSIALSDASGGTTGPIDHVLIRFKDGATTVDLLADLEAVVGAGNIAGEFIQVVAAYDKDAVGTDDRLSLYINGNLIDTTTAVGLDDWAGTSGSGLGQSNGSNLPGAFDQFIGEIAIFNVYEASLSDADVKATFDQVAGVTISSYDSTSTLGATVVLNADGSYSYDPTSATALQALQAGDTVVDTFTYTITDANGTESQATVSITVLGVNDAPSGTDGQAIIAEDTSYTFTVANFGYSDPVDGTDDAFNSVLLTTVPADGTLVFDDGVAAPVTLSAGASVSVADITSGYLTFVAAPDQNNTSTPGTSYTQFTFQVVDDGGTALTGEDTDQSPNTFTILVNPVNDAPDAFANTVSADEDVATPLTITPPTDIDDASTALTATITQVPAAGEGTIMYTPDGGGSAMLAAGDTLSMSELATLSFTSAPNYNGTITPLTYTVTDDEGLSDAGSNGTVNITLVPVNDAPVGNDDVVNVTEDTATALNPMAPTDIDDAPADLTVTITAIPNATTQGTVTYTDAGGATQTLGSGDALTLAEFATLSFTPLTDYDGLVDAITYTVSDDDGLTDTGSIAITMVPANDAPDAFTNTVSADEDVATPLTITPPTDIDDASTVLTATITQVPAAGEGTITYSLDGGGSATLAAGDTLSMSELATLSFTSAPNYNGTITPLTYTVTDDDGLSDAGSNGTVNITLVPVNDAPVGNDDVVNVTEDTVTFLNPTPPTDVDDAPTSLTITINQVPNALVQGIVSYTTSGGATATLALGDTLTPAEFNTLRFTPIANYDGLVDTITYTVTDDDNFSDAGSNGSIAITLVAVNDAPDAFLNSVSVVEDTPTPLPVTLPTDVDDALTDLTVTINQVPNPLTQGTVTYTLDGGGTATLSSGSVLSVTEFDTLNFTPVQDFSGSIPSLRYTVRDDDNAADLGSNGTINIIMVPVNDAPDATNESVDVVEDTATALNPTPPVDPDDAPLNLSITITQVPNSITQGTVTYLNGGVSQTLAANDVLTLAQFDTLTFAPVAGYTGSVDSILYTVEDDDNFSDSGSNGSISIVIIEFNDAPEAFADVVGVAEEGTVALNVTAPVDVDDVAA